MADQQAERHVLDEHDRRLPRLRKRHLLTVTGLVGGTLAMMAIYHGHRHNGDAETAAPTIAQITPFQRTPAVPAAFQVPIRPPIPAPPPLPVAEPPPAPPVPDNSLAKAEDADPLVASPGFFKQETEAPGRAASAVNEAADHETALGKRLHGTDLPTAYATTVKDPLYTITEGTVIPCVLDTALDSTAPGMVRCHTLQDVYNSIHPSVRLLPAGTEFIGEYGSDMQRGQNRLFVAWTRAITPDGASIMIKSPATDGLGRAGFDGYVNNHFWGRMGDALLLTLVDTVGGVASNLAMRGGSQLNLSFGPGESAANTALQAGINIPPTISKNQGSIVGIFVAEDWNFRGVYDLEAR